MNATGWEQMMDGQLIQAAVTMYNIEVGGWVIGVLFLVYQFMLYMKTRNHAACVVITILFCGLFFTSVLLPTYSMIIITVVLVFQLGAIFMHWIFG
jgi:hypothetical protein